MFVLDTYSHSQELRFTVRGSISWRRDLWLFFAWKYTVVLGNRTEALLCSCVCKWSFWSGSLFWCVVWLVCCIFFHVFVDFDFFFSVFLCFFSYISRLSCCPKALRSVGQLGQLVQLLSKLWRLHTAAQPCPAGGPSWSRLALWRRHWWRPVLWFFAVDLGLWLHI